MHSIATPAQRAGHVPALGWLLGCGAVTGAIDLAFAMAWWVPQGASLLRVPQSVAAWFIGSAAFHGGIPAALLGVALQWLLMTSFATLYFALARRFALLVHAPLRCGAAYGALAYVAQHVVLLPAFGANHPAVPAAEPWTLACLAVYMLLVGIPCGLFARAALQADAGTVG